MLTVQPDRNTQLRDFAMTLDCVKLKTLTDTLSIARKPVQLKKKCSFLTENNLYHLGHDQSVFKTFKSLLSYTENIKSVTNPLRTRCCWGNGHHVDPGAGQKTPSDRPELEGLLPHFLPSLRLPKGFLHLLWTPSSHFLDK